MKTIVFALNGKTYIGQLVEKQAQIPTSVYANLSETNDSGSIVIPNNDYVVVYAPALIEFSIVKTSETTAKLNWNITPLMFGNLIAGSVNTNFWQFKRSEISISAFREDDLDTSLISAYKELI